MVVPLDLRLARASILPRAKICKGRTRNRPRRLPLHQAPQQVSGSLILLQHEGTRMKVKRLGLDQLLRVSALIKWHAIEKECEQS